MNNISPLFYKHTHHDRFLNNISISDEQDQMLLEARKKIRAPFGARPVSQPGVSKAR
jgi:hypothetical protein